MSQALVQCDKYNIKGAHSQAAVLIPGSIKIVYIDIEVFVINSVLSPARNIY